MFKVILLLVILFLLFVAIVFVIVPACIALEESGLWDRITEWWIKLFSKKEK